MLKLRNLLFIAILLVGIGVLRSSLSASPRAAADPLAGTVLTGITRGTNGEPLEGVAVSARAADKTYTTTVYSDDRGNYVFPPLDSGKYRVWAQAVGYDITSAELNVDATQQNRHEFTMKNIADYTSQLSTAEWLDALPEDTPANHRIKEIFRNNCVYCHQANFILQNRFDEAGWRAILDVMEKIGFYGEQRPEDITIHHHKEELIAYLAKVRGPNSPTPNFKLIPRPKGDAARVVITEYDVPIAEKPDEWIPQDGSNWSQGVPSLRGRGVHDVIVDFDGKVWITDGQSNTSESFAKLDPKTGQVTGFRLPTADGRFARGDHGITRDQNGMIWFDLHEGVGLTGFGGLARLDPKTEKLDIFTAPRKMGRGTSTSVDYDATGKIWTATAYGSIVFDPTTQKFTYFQNVTPGDGSTYGATGDVDGNGWWTQMNQDIVGMADYKTGKSKEVKMRPRTEMQELMTSEDMKFYEANGALTWGGISTVPWAEYPRRLGADKSAPYVWVPNWYGHNFARIDTRNHEVTYFDLPIKSNPYFSVVDKNHAVWTNLMPDDRVAKFDTKTQQWTIYKLPSLGTVSRNIAVDDHGKDPEVWLPYWGTNRVARLQFRTADQLKVVTAQAQR